MLIAIDNNTSLQIKTKQKNCIIWTYAGASLYSASSEYGVDNNLNNNLVWGYKMLVSQKIKLKCIKTQYYQFEIYCVLLNIIIILGNF